MVSETIETSFTLTPSDVRTFRWFMLRRSWLLLGWVACAVLLVMLHSLYEWQLYVLLQEMGVSDAAAANLSTYIPLAGVVLLMLVLLRIRARREAGRRQRRPMYRVQHWTIGPAGLTVVRQGMRGEVEWTAIASIRRRKHATYLYLDDAQAYIVPARAFASAGAFSDFNQTVQRYFEAAHPGGR